jgi:hypothetical protein
MEKSDFNISLYESVPKLETMLCDITTKALFIYVK